MYTKSEAIAPLKYMGYAAYVLVPYVGHRLIAEDLSCSAEEAYKVMVASRKVGTILHPMDDSDPDIDDAININNKMIRRDKQRVLFYFLSFVVILVLTTALKALAIAEGRDPDQLNPCDANGRPLPRPIHQVWRFQVSNTSLTIFFLAVCHLKSVEIQLSLSDHQEPFVSL